MSIVLEPKYQYSKYTLVALPGRLNLNKINQIRDYLYQNDFRYQNKPLKDDSHISIAQVKIKDNNEINILKEILEKHFINYKSFNIKWSDIINREHKWIYKDPMLTQKYPNGCSWVALIFDDMNLKKLADECINIAEKLGINDTDQYANNIRNSQPIELQKPKTIDYVADHMNICNYARLDKSEEAVSYFKNNYKDNSIFINTVGLVSDKQELIWSIELQ